MVKWNCDFSYAIGLFTADGNISPDGRHLEFCSKDLELVKSIKKCSNLNNKICLKQRGAYPRKWYHRIQFGNKELYNFFLKIGLTPNKSNSLTYLKIPKKYFCDFLRGLIDGDGHIHFFRHPESQFLQLNLRIISGSSSFLTWLKDYICDCFGVFGKVREVPRAYELNYYKRDSKIIFKKIYNSKKGPCLKRKFKTAKLFFSEGGGIGKRASLRS